MLLAEDEPLNREVALELLGEIPDLQIDVAENGESALQLASSKRYDLILMDMQMPVMDGLTATRRIRDDERQSGHDRRTIIAMTANAQNSDRSDCLAAGMDDFLTKPINAGQVRSLLASHFPA